jgi:sec-independent protein translocase protein TatA
MLLFLNDIAGSEVLLILIFILIFFGSKSIPGIAKTFGRTMYQIKQASSDLQEEIKKSGVDIKNDLNISSFIKETTEEIQRPLDQQMVEMDNIINYNPPKKNNELIIDSEINKSITPELKENNSDDIISNL